MNAATVTLFIYFVGIAAIVDRPSGGKVAIFPTARTGTYENIILWPHRTYLNLRGSDFLDDAGKPLTDPATYCTDIGGTWRPGQPNDPEHLKNICRMELRGARLSTQTAEALTQDATFRKLPPFGSLCADAPTPKRVYTEGTDPDFVAARFDITGGVLSGCNRKLGAFVTRLTTETTYGVLVIERGNGITRIRLRDDAVVSIENRADDTVQGRSHTHTGKPDESGCTDGGREHFAWYHFMASGEIRCRVRCPSEVPNQACNGIPGVLDPGVGLPSASGPDCGNTGYP
jgi:hypothetical protein